MPSWRASSVPPLIAVALVACLGDRVAHAQPGTPATNEAQSLYDDATSAMDEGRFSAACPKLERVTVLVPEGLGARLTLAECYEKDGKLATALRSYQALLPTLVRAGQPERQAKAMERILALTDRVSTLSWGIPKDLEEASGVELRLDGRILDRSDWGQPTAVDGGDHSVDLSAPGRIRFHVEIVIARDGEHQVVSLPSITSKPVPAKEVPAALSRTWQLPLGIALISGGAVTAGVGLGLGGVAMSRKNASEAQCNAALACTSTGMALRNEGRTFADAATALLVIGGVSTGAGIVVATTAPKSPSPNASVALRIGPLAIDLQGHF